MAHLEIIVDNSARKLAVWVYSSGVDGKTSEVLFRALTQEEVMEHLKTPGIVIEAAVAGFRNGWELSVNSEWEIRARVPACKEHVLVPITWKEEND